MVSKSRADIAKMFDKVAPKYDIVNTLLSANQDFHWREITKQTINPKNGDKILDLAAGTGVSTVGLTLSGAFAVAVDISKKMLMESKSSWLPKIVADGSQLPFADNIFDCVTCSFGIRNMEDVPLVLQELMRITKPGGKLVICEFSTPVWGWFRKWYFFYLTQLLTRTAKLISSSPDAYVYLAKTIREWPDQVSFAQIIRRSGWGNVQWKNLSGGIVAVHTAQKMPCAIKGELKTR